MQTIPLNQIPIIEVKLLQSSGKTLTTLHNNYKNENKQKKYKVLKQFDKKRLSIKMNKMFTINIHSLGNDPNANLRAFSIIILKLIHEREDGEDILISIKTYLFSDKFDLSTICSFPQQFPYKQLNGLSNLSMKKIITQYFNLIRYPTQQSTSMTSTSLFNQLITTYPLALQLLVILFRTLLYNLKFPQSQSYNKKLSTTACFQILFDFLDIFYNKSGNIYLLRDDNLFIQNGYQNQKKQFVPEIMIGDYYDNQQQYVKSKKNKQVYESAIITIGNNNNIKQNQFKISLPQTSQDLENTFNNKDTNIIKNSNIIRYKSFNLQSNRSEVSLTYQDFQNDNPTPSFNNDPDNIKLQSSISFGLQQNNLSPHSIRSKNPTNSFNHMKSSATIVSTRNKILKSSIFDDIVQEKTQEKGSIQLTENIMKELGVKNNQLINGLDTNDTPNNHNQNLLFPLVDNHLKYRKSVQIMQITPLITQSIHNNQIIQQINSNNIIQQHQLKKTMKKSQSQRNSFLKNEIEDNFDQFSQINTQSKSLFSIKCKKLKTSIQFDESYYPQSYHKKKNKKMLYLQQHNCQHSTSSCSCTIIKLKKNKIYSNVVSFMYQPYKIQHKININNQQKVNFFNKSYNPQQNKHTKTSFKLTDEFFKNLKYKRQLNKQASKTKSQKPIKQQKNIMKLQTKYSQFVKVQQDTPSIKSKTPNNHQKNIKKHDYLFKNDKNQINSSYNNNFINQINKFDNRYKIHKQKQKNVSNLTIYNKAQQQGQILNKQVLPIRTFLHKQFKPINQFPYKHMIQYNKNKKQHNQIHQNQYSFNNNQINSFNNNSTNYFNDNSISIINNNNMSNNNNSISNNNNSVNKNNSSKKQYLLQTVNNAKKQTMFNHNNFNNKIIISKNINNLATTTTIDNNMNKKQLNINSTFSPNSSIGNQKNKINHQNHHQFINQYNNVNQINNMSHMINDNNMINNNMNNMINNRNYNNMINNNKNTINYKLYTNK